MLSVCAVFFVLFLKFHSVTLFKLHYVHVTFFSRRFLITLQFFRVALFSCSTIFVFHFLLVTLFLCCTFPYCTPFMFCYFFQFSCFLRAILFSCCTHSFHVLLFPSCTFLYSLFWTFFILHYFHAAFIFRVALFSCCSYLSCCTIFILNFLRVALFSYCTVVHESFQNRFSVKKLWIDCLFFICCVKPET